jgi:tetraacyldisaccharide 4'-kinase
MSLALAPLGNLYSAAMKVRRALYRSGKLPSFELGVPVISVGNLTTGGTGKTPLVAWIAHELAQSGKRVCILTRGYGRPRAGTRVVVSDQTGVIADADRAGDEPRLLAEQLQGEAAVICDADRVLAARWARQNLNSEVFVLDDGFQHLRVARDLNILTIDATNPWGNGRVLPAGILREPIAEMDRADCIVITRADDSNSTEAVLREIAGHHNGCPIFAARTRLSGVRPVQGSVAEPFLSQEEIRASNVAAFCGIGNPESFFSLLRGNGFELAHTRAFRDHQNYSQRDLDRLVRESKTHSAQILLTTAKDEVKLRSMRFELPCYAVDIALEIEREDEFRALIRRAAIPKSA